MKVRDGGAVRNKACYVAIGVNLEGERDVLGLWFQDGEGAKFWLAVLNELKQRGVRDVLICCVDGLKGFPEAIEAVFPQTWVQTCIVHLIRHSLRFVPDKHRRQVAKDLRPIYRAVNADAAADALEAFDSEWGERYPMIGQSWREAWDHVIPFLAFPPDVRRVVYTTNTIEALHRQIRKTIKTRGHFPTEEAARKLIYLSIRNAQKSWTRPTTGAQPYCHSKSTSETDCPDPLHRNRTPSPACDRGEGGSALEHRDIDRGRTSGIRPPLLEQGQAQVSQDGGEQSAPYRCRPARSPPSTSYRQRPRGPALPGRARRLRRSAQLPQPQLEARPARGRGRAVRRIYDLRHTFATFALRAGLSTFELSRYMGASLTMIDRHYGHLARDGREHAIRLLDDLNAQAVDIVDVRWTLKRPQLVRSGQQKLRVLSRQ